MLHPDKKSWIPVREKSDFPIQNIPFGVFRKKNQKPRLATIIGDEVIDLHELFLQDLLSGTGTAGVFESSTLNSFIGQGKKITNAVRAAVMNLFDEKNTVIKNNEALKGKILSSYLDVEMLMPLSVCDYTDFFSSRQHATNTGLMFRDPANALLPNWLHIPVGYHGRASSIVVSGINFHRPKGQRKGPNDLVPVFGPSQQMDFELEVAFVVGKSTNLGDSITTSEADEHIFGLVLFNDWSARDIQSWEYVPLGPFLGKNFCSSVSPWIVTLEALEPFRVAGEKQLPEVLPYLKFEGDKNININLEVALMPINSEETTISKSNYKYMYWNMEQQLAHHTVNGCNINVGDLMASGTISGNDESAYGSMLELTWRGTKPLKLNDGSERKFLADNDTIIMRGYSEKDGLRIGFGEVRAKVLPAKE